MDKGVPAAQQLHTCPSGNLESEHSLQHSTIRLGPAPTDRELPSRPGSLRLEDALGRRQNPQRLAHKTITDIYLTMRIISLPKGQRRTSMGKAHCLLKGRLSRKPGRQASAAEGMGSESSCDPPDASVTASGPGNPTGQSLQPGRSG